ncbi:MAG: hypothetical protein AB7U29_18655 [Desulfobulbus sp.]
MEDEQRHMAATDRWAFFDKIYCITLKSRPDRTHGAKQQFAAVGLVDRVTFHVTEKDSEHPARGIYHSHMACLTKGLAAGARHILIFEDDILFRGFSEPALSEACAFIRHQPRWDAFFLGCLIERSTVTECRTLIRVRYRCLAHAYCLSASFANRIVREPWQDIPFDDFLRRRHGVFFALSPMCAFQGKSLSDNRTVVIERLRTLCGGLTFIQRCNEFFHNNKQTIILVHIFLGAILLLLFSLKP